MSACESQSTREGALIISCGSVTPESIILRILDVESLPETLQYENIKGYLWSFNTKYYSAKVNLYALEDKGELDSSFSDSIKAVIFYFDSQSQSSFEDVISWMPHIKNIEAEVQLLLCTNCEDECESADLQRKNILTWCAENQFELVELNAPQESDDEDEVAFKDARGYGRVLEALQSHTWANLILKNVTFELSKSSATVEPENAEEKESENSNSPQDLSGAAACGKDSEAAASKDGVKTISVQGEELQLEEKWLNNVLSGEDPGGESFEALFSRFASMKDRASGLSGEDRKKYAEQVAVAFWRAMGGDEDEIEGIGDLDN